MGSFPHDNSAYAENIQCTYFYGEFSLSMGFSQLSLLLIVGSSARNISCSQTYHIFSAPWSLYRTLNSFCPTRRPWKPVASVVVHACDPSSLEDEVGGPWIQGQPLLRYEPHVVELLLSVSAGPTVWMQTESFFPVDPIPEPKPQVFCNFYTYLAELLMMTVIEK